MFSNRKYALFYRKSYYFEFFTSTAEAISWQSAISTNSLLFIWKSKSISIFSSSPLFYHTVVTCQTPCCPVFTYYKYTFVVVDDTLLYCKLLLLCSTSCSFLTTKSYRLSTKLCTVGSFSYGLCKGGVDKCKDLWTHLSLNYFLYIVMFYLLHAK